MAGERNLPGLGLIGFWDLNSQGWKDGMDQNLLALSVLDKLIVSSRTAPIPIAPTQGTIIIAPAGDINAGKVGAFDAGAWKWYTPSSGWLAYVVDEGVLQIFNGASWLDLGSVFGKISGLHVDGGTILDGRLDGNDINSRTGHVNSTVAAGNAHFWMNDGIGNRMAVVYAAADGSIAGFHKYNAAGAVTGRVYLYDDDIKLLGLTGAISAESAMTAGRGDARYPVKDVNGDISLFHRLSFSRNVTAAYITTLAGVLPVFDQGGVHVARVDAAGTNTPSPITLMTAEKADARYLNLTGGSLTGGFRAMNNIYVTSTTPTANAHYWLQSDAYAATGLLYATPDHLGVYLRKYNSAGGVTAQLSLVDNDIQLAHMNNTTLQAGSLISVVRGDARYVRDTRLAGGVQTAMAATGWTHSTAGYTITGLHRDANGLISHFYGKAIQVYINGVWATITG